VGGGGGGGGVGVHGEVAMREIQVTVGGGACCD
jgi:hypothetical protein